MAKRKRILEEPIPLKMVKDFENEFNNCYSIADKLIKDSKADGKEIWDLCYIPIAAANAVMSECYKNVQYGYMLHTLYSWRINKQIFSFDSTLVENLIDSTEYEEPIPIEALEHVPYPCFYIDCSFDCNLGSGMRGFFVSFDHYMSDREHTEAPHEIRLSVVLDKSGNSSFDSGIFSEVMILPVYIPLINGKTIQESLLSSDAFKQTGKNTNVISMQMARELSSDYQKLIQLVLYTVCTNADIQENKTQKQYKRKPSSQEFIKDKMTEIESWDVGWRTGASIRQARSTQVKTEDETERIYHRKRPHVRRSHYHHFWTGKRDNPEERKMILKWLPPTAVNCSYDNELPAVIRKEQI